MVIDYLFRVVHAAVTDLDGVSVEGISEDLMRELRGICERATTRQSPQRKFLPASTNGSRPYHLIKHPLTKQHLLTRKHSMKVDTTRPCSTNQPKQANVKTDNTTISSGTTLCLAKTSDTNASP